MLVLGWFWTRRPTARPGLPENPRKTPEKPTPDAAKIHDTARHKESSAPSTTLPASASSSGTDAAPAGLSAAKSPFAFPLDVLDASNRAFLHISSSHEIDWANDAARAIFSLSLLPVKAESVLPEYAAVSESVSIEVLKDPDRFDGIYRFTRTPDAHGSGFWLEAEEIANVSAYLENSREIRISTDPGGPHRPPLTVGTYDELRFEMWRMFSQDPPENRNGIFQLLSLLGPGIGVSRTSFYELQPDQSLICQIEWCASDMKPSVGLVLPPFIVKPFLTDNFYICTPQSVLQALPGIVQPLAKPIVWGIYHTYSLELVIACPIKLENDFEGALMLSLCKGHPDVGRFMRLAPDLKALLEDARQLIGHTVYRLRIEEGRKRALDALRESENKYRNIFESLHDVYYRTDLGGRIMMISPSCRRVFGYAPEELIGRNLMQDFYVDRERRLEFLEKLDSQGRVMEFETRMRTKEGREIWVSTNANYFVEENNAIGGIEGILRDITERKNLEDQLIRAERMAAVGTLAGGVAHEFNNINLAILGYAELGLMRKGLDEETEHYLQVIRKSALRAKNITSNLLTFAGSTMGKVTFANVATVLDDTLQMIRHELANSGIAVEKDYEEVPDCLMDTSQIGQVFLNMIINAQHALIDRPERRISLRIRQENDFVCVSISDTGCGIPPEHIKRIFSPFFTTKGEHAQGDTPMARVKGTGLGLSVSHSIVLNHRGVIEVSSRLNEGTTFTVKLPASQVRLANDSAPAQTVLAPPMKLRVLVLDDEQDLRELLAAYLQKQGHAVDHTDSGQTALEMLRRQHYDVALVDLQMPMMNGQEFIAQALALPERLRPRVVVISGQNPVNLTEQEKVAAILFKPFRLSEIAQVISDAVFKPAGKTP
ncbi:MAG: Virulence sensor protein BvgS precursor [Syntrophus sp. PtaU1.Bin208]|nr:MAG: Virulence sensor protein BvgS precursor [Syntrophus sp. PtaU1.Bin208]